MVAGHQHRTIRRHRLHRALPHELQAVLQGIVQGLVDRGCRCNAGPETGSTAAMRSRRWCDNRPDGGTRMGNHPEVQTGLARGRWSSASCGHSWGDERRSAPTWKTSVRWTGCRSAEPDGHRFRLDAKRNSGRVRIRSKARGRGTSVDGLLRLSFQDLCPGRSFTPDGLREFGALCGRSPRAASEPGDRPASPRIPGVDRTPRRCHREHAPAALLQHHHPPSRPVTWRESRRSVAFPSPPARPPPRARRRRPPR